MALTIFEAMQFAGIGVVILEGSAICSKVLADLRAKVTNERFPLETRNMFARLALRRGCRRWRQSRAR
jgi:hypothetical protein